jgi:hypothetical protein
MAAVIANEFTEANDLYLNALVEIGLVLFVITLAINALSRLLIWSMNRPAAPRIVRAAAVRARMTRDRRRKALSHLVVGCAARGGLALVPLAFVLFHVVTQGIGALNLVLHPHPVPVGEAGGGMANAIVGTLMVTASARSSPSRSGS